MPVAIEQTALGETSVYINGGQRGLQIELAPDDAQQALGAIVAALVDVSDAARASPAPPRAWSQCISAIDARPKSVSGP